MRIQFFLLLVFNIISFIGSSQEGRFNGLNMSLGNVYRVSDAETRSISPENFTGEPGKGGMAELGEGTGSEPARELGQGWKVSPSVKIEPGGTFTLAEITDEGVIQHIWMTPTGNWRFSILRFYWDDEKEPSIEVPVGDFFGMGWGEYAHLNSQPVTVNPGSAFNSYWPMPFRKKCRITMENIGSREMFLYYQIDYTLTDVPEDAAYLHAQFRRSNPTKGSIHTLVDGIKGKGHYVGTYLAWQVNNKGWWGEGEIKFYMDGDKKFPTIAGTGTEDYFLGSYNFDRNGEYQYFSTPFAGLHQIIRPDGNYNSQQRFGMYRWHIQDPIRFDKELKVTIQDLGWRSDHRYLQQKSDISSVVYWYQLEPHASFPALPSKDDLEVN
ncbi:glycoside hydrolase family 172 protein [Autumnicola musiva]|uniref:Glycoside hydrolase family 172 protein n=1 Tax=Autumnicola musiva TaxID=3075589 RepID=A0ABU3DAF0_9FLAO|nr:glycoside hydrolase family 172 protein [Zunongwangia sp. F117]MDT0678509.1 glycoside hydrolase family 172 protein [Zunongwangia sp. F117]